MRLGARARDLGAVAVLVVWLLLISWRYFGADRGGFTEEAVPFRQALTLWGWGASPPTANPHFFSYPSLSIYAHAAVQGLATAFGLWTRRYGDPADAGVEFVLDPTYLVVASRALLALVTFAAAWTILAWWRSRSRLLGVLTALGFCLCPLVVRSILRMPPEVFMAPLVVLLVSAATAEQRSRRSRAVWTGILAGLLLGTKLSAMLAAVLCLAYACGAHRAPASALRSMALAGSCALISFVVTTPFAVLDFASFAQGTRFEWEHLATGHLLGTAGASAGAHGRQLFAAVGYPLVAGLLVLPGVGRSLSARAWLALGSAAAYVIPALLAASGGPDRYMLPAIPLLWLFAAEVLYAAAREGGARWRVASLVLGSAGILQLGVMASTVLLGRLEVPTAAAGDWLRQHAKPDDVIVQERGALALPSLANARELQSSRCYAAASPPWQEAARTARWFSVIPLPFVASGEISTEVAIADGRMVRVRAFAPSWNLLPAVYESLGEIQVQYLARTQTISGRLARLFPSLAPGAATTVSFAGAMGRAREDATVTIQAGAAPTSAEQALAGDWWAQGGEFVVVAPGDARLSPSEAREVRMTARRQVFRQWFEPLLMELAERSLARRDLESAARASRLILLNVPDHVTATRSAMLAMSGIQGPVPGAVPATVLARAAGETEGDWLERVLREWRVDPAIIHSELTRFLAWRRGPAAPATR